MKEEGTRAEWLCRLAASATSLTLAADLVFIVVTGGLSILTPWAEPTPQAFLIREALLGLALVARLRVFTRTDRRISAGQLMLMVAVFPALFHLHFQGRRITGDGLYYYVYTRSMIRDADLNFENEYAHYDLLTRGDLAVPTTTGHRRSNYPIGPGLMWTPFFVAADALGAGLEAVGLEVNDSGYGRLNLNAVALGSLSYGVLALFLIHAFLRPHFGDRLAGGATLLLWWASFFAWYVAEQPLTSHPVSAGLVAAFFLLRQNGALKTWAGTFALGLTLGLGMSVRWQNGVFLMLPAADLLVSLRTAPAGRGAVVARGLLLCASVFAGALPQMLAWKAIYGEYLLPYPPQGVDFVRLDHPYLMNLLFSSRHGLLSWTPVFWLCLFGLGALTRARPRRFAILWGPLLAMTYVNACIGDWWGGGSFSARRFDSLLPIFALGLAAFLQAAQGFIRRRPAFLPAALVVGGAVWNVSLLRAVQLEEISPGLPASFAARALASARAVSHDVGFPTTWPASWIFASRHDASPAAYDLAVGKYLFYRQNNLQGLADLGSAGDEALFLDGLSAARQEGPATYRAFGPAARLIVSLDLPEDLGLSFRARGSGGSSATVRVLVNGTHIGTLALPPHWVEVRLEAPQHLWTSDSNVISLRSDQPADLDRVTFMRAVR